MYTRRRCTEHTIAHEYIAKRDRRFFDDTISRINQSNPVAVRSGSIGERHVAGQHQPQDRTIIAKGGLHKQR